MNGSEAQRQLLWKVDLLGSLRYPRIRIGWPKVFYNTPLEDGTYRVSGGYRALFGHCNVLFPHPRIYPRYGAGQYPFACSDASARGVMS